MAKSTTATKAATEAVATETEVLKFATIEEENAYYNQPVKVKLFKDNGKYNGDVFVGVNGTGMLIPRGVEVEIPRKYAEALKNSELQDSFSADYQTELANSADATELSE